MQPKSTHSAGADNVFSSVADPNLNPSVISSTMAISEVISTLVSNGCPDVTGDLDPKRCGNRPISGGGFGDVYQGRLTNNKSIAIKCARLYLLQGNDGYKVLKRAARELHAWSTLRHENILELVGLALFRDQLSMISPWMDGGALPDYIERNPNVDRLQLCSQISTGLTYLHQSGMTHGDVKGLNVLISKRGVAKLTDFGNTVLKNYTLQFTGVISASNYTLRWAAPELLDGTLNVCNEKADVYALGMTILEVITGEVPFRDKPDQAIFNYVVLKHGIPTRPTTLLSTTEESAGVLWRLLLQCWGHDPNARPTSTSVQTSLDSILLSKAVGKLESGSKKVACSPQGSSNTVAETLSRFEPSERPVGEQSRPSISTDEHNHISQTTDTNSYRTRLLPSPPATGRASSRPSLKIDLTNASHYRPSSETEYCAVSDVHIPPTTTADAGQYLPVTGINTVDLGKIRDVIGKLNSDKETPG
ncbi:kinase-like protein, partial [Ceratobasidium sp. AG-I]